MNTRQRSFGIGSKTLVTVAALIIIVAGLRAAGSMLLPLLVAVFLSILTAPMVLWLERRGLAAWIAVTVVMVTVSGVLVIFGALLSSALLGFDEALPVYRTALSHNLDAFIERLQSYGATISTDTLNQVMDPGIAVSMAGNLITSVVAALSNTLLVALTMMFILLEVAGFPRKLRAALEDPNADLSNYVGMLSEVQRYLVIKTIVSFATGTAATLWLLVLQVDFPLLWGLVAFLLNYIPTVGSILAAIPAVLIAMVQPDLTLLAPVAVMAGYFVINTVLGNIVEPQLLGRRLGLSPLVVFASLVFWGWVWGPVGMLLSVPLTVGVKIMLEGSDELRWIAVFLGSLPEIDPDPGTSMVARIRMRRGVRPEDILRTGVLDRVEIERSPQDSFFGTAPTPSAEPSSSTKGSADAATHEDNSPSSK